MLALLARDLVALAAVNDALDRALPWAPLRAGPLDVVKSLLAADSVHRIAPLRTDWAAA